MAQEYIAEHLLSLPIRFQDSIVEWTWNFYATFQFLFHVFFWAKNEVLMTLTTLENDVIIIFICHWKLMVKSSGPEHVRNFEN